MSNNQSIKILRGSRDSIASNASKLKKGQPLFNTDDGYLTVGTADDSNLNQQPIVVREVKGYKADNNGIVTSSTKSNTPGEWHVGPDSNGFEIKVDGVPLTISDSNNLTIKTINNGADVAKIEITNDPSSGAITVTRGNNTKVTITNGEISIQSNSTSDGQVILNSSGTTVKSGNSGVTIIRNGNTEISNANNTIATITSNGMTIGSDNYSPSNKKITGLITKSLEARNLASNSVTLTSNKNGSLTVKAGQDDGCATATVGEVHAWDVNVGGSNTCKFRINSGTPSSIEDSTIYLIY